MDDMAPLTLGTKLGAGAFGEVYVGTLGSQRVAVKVLAPSQHHLRSLLSEIHLHTSLLHPNLVRILRYSYNRIMSSAHSEPGSGGSHGDSTAYQGSEHSSGVRGYNASGPVAGSKSAGGGTALYQDDSTLSFKPRPATSDSLDNDTFDAEHSQGAGCMLDQLDRLANRSADGQHGFGDAPPSTSSAPCMVVHIVLEFCDAGSLTDLTTRCRRVDIDGGAQMQGAGEGDSSNSPRFMFSPPDSMSRGANRPWASFGMSSERHIPPPPLDYLVGAVLLLEDVAAALAFLHDHHVVHGDLKAQNVLLTTAPGRGPLNLTAKLADLGLSVMADERMGMGGVPSSVRGGTISHMAPEALLSAMPAMPPPIVMSSEPNLNADLNEMDSWEDALPNSPLSPGSPGDMGGVRMMALSNRSQIRNVGPVPGAGQGGAAGGAWSQDVYAFAVLALETLTCQLPYLGVQHQQIILRVTSGQRPFIPYWMPLPLEALIRRCWAQDPAARPPMAMVLARLRALPPLQLRSKD